MAFLSRWESAARTFERHRWMTPGRRGVWGALRAVRSLWRARYVIVHQGLPGRRYLAVPPWKVVLLRHEPPDVVADWPDKSVGWARFMRPAFLQSFGSGQIPMVATWWINMDYDALSALSPPPKRRPLSCITSSKAWLPGHRRRLEFVQGLATAHGDDVDVFGRGLAALALGPAYKGPLERDSGFPLGRNCKYGGLRDYRYALCIENARERNYYTEKIVDAWLSWAVPIYWGCPNLADYYPRESFMEIDITAPGSADEVVRRAREPVSRLTMAAIAEARHLALNRYSTWGTLQHLVDEWRAAG